MKKPAEDMVNDRLVANLIMKYAFLVCLGSGFLALLLNYRNGGSWQSALWHAFIAAAGTSMLGMMIVRPLFKALKPIPKETEDEEEEKNEKKPGQEDPKQAPAEPVPKPAKAEATAVGTGT